MLSSASAYGLRFVFPEQDQIIGASLKQHGEFARVESDLISHYLGKSGGGCLLDVGANIGSICLPVAKLHPACTVVAIEAHRGLHGLLSTNAINNALYNVAAYHVAAGATSGLVQFPAPQMNASRNFGELGLHIKDGAMETVRMVTLDEIAPVNCTFVKLDVEGFEDEVLRGAPNLLMNIRPAWFFEANPSTKQVSSKVMRTFMEAGYALYWFFAPFVIAPGAQQFRGDTNVLALPQGMENDWGLTRVIDADEERPGVMSAYPYLQRYAGGPPHAP